MSQSIKDKIRDAIKYNLEQITTTNGYGTTVGDVTLISIDPDEMINFPVIKIDIEEHVQSADNQGFTVTQLEKELTVTLECWFNNINGISDERDQLLADIEVLTTMKHYLPDSDGNATAQYCMLMSSEDFGFQGTRPMGGITIKINVQYAQAILDSTVTT